MTTGRTDQDIRVIRRADDPAPLDRWRADQVLEPDRQLWGLGAIARAAGVSEDTARRWSRHTDAPISKPGGRYFAMRSELLAWLRARKT